MIQSKVVIDSFDLYICLRNNNNNNNNNNNQVNRRMNDGSIESGNLNPANPSLFVCLASEREAVKITMKVKNEKKLIKLLLEKGSQFKLFKKIIFVTFRKYLNNTYYEYKRSSSNNIIYSNDNNNNSNFNYNNNNNISNNKYIRHAQSTPTSLKIGNHTQSVSSEA